MPRPIKDIFKKDSNVKINGSLWIEANGEHFFGPGPMELLERIAETGSISSAAKEMKMSYKKAWELVSRLNGYTSSPMVVPQTGGEKGGGSTVTAEALELIQYHHKLRKRFEAFLKNETERLKT